jgi:hypothetical protein
MLELTELVSYFVPQVEDREYCIHRYFFERESLKFRTLLASPSPGQPQQGSSHLTAIKLHNVTAKDFEKFLWVFYNPSVLHYPSFNDRTDF